VTRGTWGYTKALDAVNRNLRGDPPNREEKRMGIPNSAAPLPAPPANESDTSITFAQGHQTFTGDIADGVYPATVAKFKRTQSTFQGQTKDQFVFLFTVDGREADKELAYYTGCKMSNDPKTKLPPLLDALKLARPTPASPNLPNPVGAKCRIMVLNQPGKNDATKKFPKITAVLAA